MCFVYCYCFVHFMLINNEHYSQGGTAIRTNDTGELTLQQEFLGSPVPRSYASTRAPRDFHVWFSPAGTSGRPEPARRADLWQKIRYTGRIWRKVRALKWHGDIVCWNRMKELAQDILWTWNEKNRSFNSPISTSGILVPRDTLLLG